MYPHGKPSAPAPSAPPLAGPSGYPSLEKPYTNYPHPPPPGPDGYPPQFGQQSRVVEGIPLPAPVGNMNHPQPHPHPQPQPLGFETLQAQQPGYWTTGLCDCFSDVGSCCLVIWCPCVAFGQLSEIVDKGSSSCCCNGWLYFGLCLLGAVGVQFGVPGFQWIYSCTYRGKLKQDINMPPSCCDECCVHFWCEPCALCQEYRELQNRGYDLSLGWHGNLEKRRQQAGNGMPAMVAAPIAPTMNR